MDPFDERVGARIRLRRLQLGLSQTRVAEASGITFQQLQKYEKGVNRVAASRLARVAEALDVTPAYFFAVDAGAATAARGSKESWRLVDAFGRIESRVLRKAVVALVEAMAKDGPSGDGAIR